MIVFIVIILAMIGVFSLRLYKTQAVVTEESLVAADADSMTYQSTVEAARGNILDRNGNVLVSNRASYNLVIVNFVFFNAPDPNGNLLKVLDLCDELGIQYESHFPVTPDRPYEYTDDNNSAWQENFRKFLADRGYDLDISAPTLMKRLRSEYKIPDDWKQADVYRIIAVRYELELRSIEGIGLENYTLAEDVDAESLAAVMELAVPGVVVENGTVREFQTKYAAHILGFIGAMSPEEYQEYKQKGYAMNALVGKSGVEQAFEEYLHGSSGLKKTTVSSTGEILNRYYVTEPVPGNNVELTIDISLQAVAEQSLEKVILDLRENGVGRNKEGKDARGGAVVVQACKTGEILAMASYPTYDLATLSENAVALNEDETAPLYNRALAAYPPGSVYKMVTSIAAVDLGGFDPGYIIEDKGLYTYYDSFQPKCHIWSLANPRTHGKINLMQAIAYSCNYYFYEIGRLTYNSYMEKTGENPFDIVAKALGLGEPTGIELPGEEGGLLFNTDDMRDSDVATMAIGQSIAVTPLQLVTAMSAIANDGVLLKPHIVKSITNADGSVYEEKGTTEVRRTIESATDKTLVGLLEQVVASGGGKKAAVKGYRIAGKTGTAQKIRPDGSGYMEGHYIASFCGFAPVEDPQITVLVMIDDPGTGNYYGGQIAAPVASRIFTQLFRYLHIEPSSDPFAGMESKARPSAKTQKSYSGNVPDGKVVVPDFAGKSMREAAQLASDRGLNCDPDGSGYAVSQSIPANTLVDKGTTVTVQFQSQ